MYHGDVATLVMFFVHHPTDQATKVTMRHALVLAILALTAPAGAEQYAVHSPDGRNAISVTTSDEDVRYSVARDGEPLIEPTPISLTIDGAELPASPTASSADRDQVDRTVRPVVPTISSEVRDHYNEALVRFEGDIALRVRAYDDGVAFRWETSLPSEQVKVDAERLAFRFAKDFTAYFPVPNGEGFFSHQECQFERKPLSETAGNKPGSAPLLVELGDGQYMVVSDVNVEGYPGLWFEGSDTKSIGATFPHFPARTRLQGDRNERVAEYADHLAETVGARAYPWRAMVLGDAPALLTSTMLYNLAEPGRLEDASWIRPGKVAWDWWNAWNLHGVPFRSGVNNDTYKHYIDFAAEAGLEYVILDEGWSRRGPENLLSVVDEIDIPELVAHGERKGVGVILWMTSAALAADYEEAFDQFAEWGVAGLKIDFMQRDDQPMMDFLYRAARDAAERRLLVDFHGGSKPAGLNRTWPNVLTSESVLGLEQAKWGELANPEMAVLLPFNRMVVGPMDYTPGAMINQTQEGFSPNYYRPASMGTRAHQLAMYVLYLSPLQMLADNPTHYRENPEVMPFLSGVPVTWDETRVLRAEVGDVVAVARRKGDAWWVGAMTDWSRRRLALPLDFLPAGEHTLTEWADGVNARRYPEDVRVETRSVQQDDELSLRLAPGGGYAAVIEPADG